MFVDCLNLQFFGIFTTPAFAFVGALAATALVYFLSRSSGRAKVLSMILTGIAVTAVANAIAFLMFIADTTRPRSDCALADGFAERFHVEGWRACNRLFRSAWGVFCDGFFAGCSGVG